MAILQSLAKRDDEIVKTWRQRHLIWFYLGKGFEKTGEITKAAVAYRNVIKIVPTHRPALARLAGIVDGYDKALEQLEPDNRLDVDFGGKASLIGITFSHEKIPIKLLGQTIQKNSWFLISYWQFNDRMFNDYRLVGNLLDSKGRATSFFGARFKANGILYPVDRPRNGEVLLVKTRLEKDLSTAAYMSLSVWAQSPPDSLPKSIINDGDIGALKLSLSNLAFHKSDN